MAVTLAWTSVPAGVYVDGEVVFPNGDTAAGATVTATTVCPGRVFFISTTETDEFGQFTISAPDVPCQKLRLSASKKDDLWLETGEWPDVIETNGTAPVVDLEQNLGETIALRLAKRGAEVHWSIVDDESGRTAFGRVSVRRCDGTPDRRFDIHASTSVDEPDHKLLLPEGDYCIGLMEVIVDDARRYPEGPACVPIELRAGEREIVTLPFALRRLLRKSTFV